MSINFRRGLFFFFHPFALLHLLDPLFTAPGPLNAAISSLLFCRTRLYCLQVESNLPVYRSAVRLLSPRRDDSSRSDAMFYASDVSSWSRVKYREKSSKGDSPASSLPGATMNLAILLCFTFHFLRISPSRKPEFRES